MKTSESIAVATVSLFEAVEYPFMVNRSSALQIFVSKPSNPLILAMASLCGIFRLISQQFDGRRMDTIYRIWA